MLTQINGVADEIQRIINSYNTDLRELLDIESEKIAKEAVEKLKRNSPKKRNTSKRYGNTWKVKVVKSGKEKMQVIYNDKNYQLTHLLEFGHATRNGGRTSPKEHIKPIEEEVIKRFVEAAERIIG